MLKVSILLLLCNFCFGIRKLKTFLGETVFETDHCNETCPRNKLHSMCEESKPIPCADFTLVHFVKGGETDALMRLLVEGHNGLRNRVATRMDVTNMLELTWDTMLANMSANYLRQCTERGTDPCTRYPATFRDEDTFLYFHRNNFSHEQIVQNIYIQEGMSYPYRFIEHALKNWYWEKETMREPVVKNRDGHNVGHLQGENNFTHFTNPLSFRFGCAMASYGLYYHLVCNYFPYFRTSTNKVVFSTGSPGSNCPAKFPLRDERFTYLCTDDKDSFFDNVSKVYVPILLLAFCLLVAFL